MSNHFLQPVPDIHSATYSLKRNLNDVTEIQKERESAAFEKFFAWINNCIGKELSELDKYFIRERFKFKALRKRQYFLQEGDVCRYIGFLVSGSMRMFSANEKGQEYVMNLAVEGNWINDYESYYRRIPTVYFIEAMESSEILMISHEQLSQLMTEVSAISSMINLVSESQLIDIQQRMYLAFSQSAIQRYDHLFKTKPNLIQRFPLHIIASYLFMTSETLSRVRRKGLSICKEI